jgi:hypothetical protein
MGTEKEWGYTTSTPMCQNWRAMDNLYLFYVKEIRVRQKFLINFKIQLKIIYCQKNVKLVLFDRYIAYTVLIGTRVLTVVTTSLIPAFKSPTPVTLVA